MLTPEKLPDLTWTNKPLQVLAHKGCSERVSPSGRSVAEGRLLHDAGVARRVHGKRERTKGAWEPLKGLGGV